MTPQEFNEKICNILVDYKLGNRNTLETMERISGVEAERAASQSSPFYAFIREHDNQYHALMQSQGTSSQGAIIDTMIASLMRYAATLERGV